MRCFLRYSDESHRRKVKPRPEGFTKRKCFENFLEVFGIRQVHVVADCVKPDTEEWLGSKGVTVHPTRFASGGSALIHAIELALRSAESDAEGVYFVEDDYLHLPGSREILEEGLEFGNYATLYDHPDKYADGPGANKLIRGRSEVTRLYRSKSSHWKLTNSTTLTFATRIEHLHADLPLIKKFCGADSSKDFAMWTALRKRRFLKRGRTLVSSVPGLSTHVHLPRISPNPAIYELVERLRDASE